MKNNAVVLGVFLMVGIVIGAFVISLSSREKPQELDLESVNIRIDSLANKMESLEQRINELNGKLESGLESIQEHDRNIREFKDQLAVAGKGAGDEAGKDAASKAGDKLAKALDAGNQDALEHIKEAVKREIKEERQIAQREEKAKGVRKWRDWQTAQLRKKLDDGFSRLAEKIGLDTNQELTVKDIAEEMFRQITTIWSNWEDRLDTATNEDWGEFKGELDRVYKDASTQLEGQVSDEQREAIMRFFMESGK